MNVREAGCTLDAEVAIRTEKDSIAYVCQYMVLKVDHYDKGEEEKEEKEKKEEKEEERD